jgi:hypothetical protein
VSKKTSGSDHRLGHAISHKENDVLGLAAGGELAHFPSSASNLSAVVGELDVIKTGVVATESKPIRDLGDDLQSDVAE